MLHPVALISEFLEFPEKAELIPLKNPAPDSLIPRECSFHQTAENTQKGKRIFLGGKVKLESSVRDRVGSDGGQVRGGRVSLSCHEVFSEERGPLVCLPPHGDTSVFLLPLLYNMLYLCDVPVSLAGGRWP